MYTRPNLSHLAHSDTFPRRSCVFILAVVDDCAFGGIGFLGCDRRHRGCYLLFFVGLIDNGVV